MPHVMGALMLTLDRWPNFEAQAMRALAATPAFFRELLEAHVGERSLATVLVRHAPRFVWNMVAAATDALPVAFVSERVVSDMSTM
jgi:hypothetical protein